MSVPQLDIVVYDENNIKNLEELNISEYDKIAEQNSLYIYDKTCTYINNVLTVWGFGKTLLGIVTVFI